MMLARRQIPWWYVDDAGRAWPRAADLWIIAQTDDTGSPLVGGRPQFRFVGPQPLPSSGGRLVRPRAAIVENPDTKRRRQVIVYTVDAPLWTGAVQTIPLWSNAKGAAWYGEVLLYRVVRRQPEGLLEGDYPIGAPSPDLTPALARALRPGDGPDPTVPAAFLDV